MVRKVKSLTEWDKIAPAGRRKSTLPSAAEWEGIIPSPAPAKEPVYLKLDADVLAWYRAKGRGYQQFINEVLRSYMEMREKKHS